MAKNVPVYGILDFRQKDPSVHFYANDLHIHLKDHQFTNHPHKHDFYLTVLFTKGSGTHEVDFTKYKVKPGALFTLMPGQMHSWNLSGDTRGYVFFHSKDFYEERFTNEKLKDYPFFASFNTTVLVQLRGVTLHKIESSMGDIVKEYREMDIHSGQKIHSLVNIIYIDVMRVYAPTRTSLNETYLNQVQKFEDLIELHYKTLKYPGEYAAKLHITEKHLNRITRTCINKTSSQLIAERITLEAKRLLLGSKLNITEISDELGFSDPSYFIRFFKKHEDITPLSFSKKYH
jgi:AraC family transcriptional activator of pobA